MYIQQADTQTEKSRLACLAKVTDRNVTLRPGDSRKHIDTVHWEVTALLGPNIDAVSPARVHHLLPCVLVQLDEVTSGEVEEC